MEYFFKDIDNIQRVIEDYTGVFLKENRVLYKCNFCNFYVASSDIKYNMCYKNHNDMFLTHKVKSKKTCCHCLERIKAIHNVYFIKKISD